MFNRSSSMLGARDVMPLLGGDMLMKLSQYPKGTRIRLAHASKDLCECVSSN